MATTLAENHAARPELDQVHLAPWGTTLHVGSLVTVLLDPTSGPDLPHWSYRTWWHALHYPDLADRSHRATKELGRQRDTVLDDAAVRMLVEWAGRRRRTHPVAGAAAALVTLHDARMRQRVGHPPADSAEVTRSLVIAVDHAQPLHARHTRRDATLLDPERLADRAPEPTVAEHPRLPDAVSRLLRLAGAERDHRLQRRVEGAVVQAGDWWARHARAVPADAAGPDLPGIVPAQELRASERLAAAVSATELLALVAGPRPGRGRPCQVAWRRGLTYWVAVDLATDGTGPVPGVGTLRWWHSALSEISTPDRAVAVGVKSLLQPA